MRSSQTTLCACVNLSLICFLSFYVAKLTFLCACQWLSQARPNWLSAWKPKSVRFLQSLSRQWAALSSKRPFLNLKFSMETKLKQGITGGDSSKPNIQNMLLLFSSQMLQLKLVGQNIISFLFFFSKTKEARQSIGTPTESRLALATAIESRGIFFLPRNTQFRLKWCLRIL